TEGYAEVRGGKGSKDRIVIVPRALAQELTSYIGPRRRGPLLLSQRRGSFTTRRIEQIVRGAAAAAKIPRRVTPHTLRRSMATTLLNRGVREEVVSTLLGHASTETTRAAYARLSIESLSAEVEQALATPDPRPARSGSQWPA
ncbi:MAG: tyrosine-type recombinase/integrase, partial [Planctomycetes bacterium]|nr:tyrosine-type recombinase/integrase [Planctomycetota bacterium]